MAVALAKTPKEIFLFLHNNTSAAALEESEEDHKVQGEWVSMKAD